MGKSKDFVYTIEDEDTVQDLDTEKAGELNPNFTFGDDFSKSIDETGWDFGSTKEEETNTLDEIIKRHGGLKSDKKKTEDGEEGAEEDEISVDAEGDEDDEDSGSSDSENEDKEKKENSDEPEGAGPRIADDKSGFFEEGKADMTAHKSFSHLSLSRPIQRAIAKLGYTQPTPIQSSVIPIALLGKDIVAGAVTGSGKTAAYMIPTLERLVYRPLKSPSTRVVVLTPTRELAVQVYDVGKKLGEFVPNLRFGMAVGGLNLRTQEQELKTRPDIVVATPGRFIDHVRNSPSFSVDDVEILIVDEADRMLEEGFEAELSEILSLIPSKRQTMLFSATMNSSIKSLIRLSLHKPVRIMIDPPKQAAVGLVQEFVRIRHHEDSRPAILVSLLRKISRKERIIVFVARKQTAHRLRVILGLLNLRVGELHGALSQEQRLESVTAFKNLEVPILLCTDLASRGLDIPKIEVVINYELPSTYEVYLHRVGRTARAGRSGTSISLVGDSATERQVVRSAIQSANENSKTEKQKILGRDINWEEINEIKTEIEVKQETVDQVLGEEKVAKELALAERDMVKAKNFLEHRDEIKARPKRTWFDDNATAKTKKAKTKTQKKKAEAGQEKNWAYRKTQKDRSTNTKRGSQRAMFKAGSAKAKKMM